MTVYVKNLTINGGETFSEDITLFSADGTGVVDLTGFTAQSQIRKTAASYQFADFTVGITNPTQGLVNVSIASTINEIFSIYTTIPVPKCPISFTLLYAQFGSYLIPYFTKKL